MLYREAHEDEFWDHLEEFKNGDGYEGITEREAAAIAAMMPWLHRGPVSRELADSTQYPVAEVQRGRLLALKSDRVEEPCRGCGGSGFQPCECVRRNGHCHICYNKGTRVCKDCDGTMGYYLQTVVTVAKHSDDWYWVTAVLVEDWLNPEWKHHYQDIKSVTLVCDGLAGVRQLAASVGFVYLTEPRRD